MPTLSGAELAASRAALGLTRSQLAAAFGVALRTMTRWETGVVAIPHPSIVRLALAGLARPPLPPPALRPLGIIVPAYYEEPADPLWANFAAAARAGVKLLVVLNINSGPEVVFIQQWLDRTRLIQAAGGKVVGYVRTRHGTAWQPHGPEPADPLAAGPYPAARRDRALVAAEIDRYRDWYGVDGVYLDEYEPTFDGEFGAFRDYYLFLAAHARAAIPGALVVGNPGWDGLPQSAHQIVDLVETWESGANAYLTRSFPAWQVAADPPGFAHVVVGVDGPARVAEVAAKARASGAGWLYCTKGGNPDDGGAGGAYKLWDQGIWDALVAQARGG